VLIADKADRGGVPLGKGEVSHHAKACVTVSPHEAVGLGPAVEAHAKAVTFKHTVHLSKSRFQPCAVIVIRHGASVARFVAGDVRRVGQYEVDAFGGKLRQDMEAVGIDDGVAEVGHGVSFPEWFLGCESRSHPLPPGEGGGSQVKGWEVACNFFGGTAAQRWGSQNPKGRALDQARGEAP
jgi:hypothetical protein